jgi:hypothetical protein
MKVMCRDSSSPAGWSTGVRKGNGDEGGRPLCVGFHVDDDVGKYKITLL